MDDAKIKDLVSICMPTYNGAQFLGKAIESALSQTHTDIELLICDDASEDDTLRIAKEYATRDPRIKIHCNKQRLGLAGNWNRCIELSAGEWVKFLFQDDYLESTCLERLLSLCLQHACDFAACERHLVFEPDVSGEFKRVFQEYVKENCLTNRFPNQANVINGDEFAQHAARYPHYNCIGEPTAVIFRRSLVQRFGYFNVNLNQLTDWEYWMRLGIHTGVGYIPDKLATFRLHEGATSLHSTAESGFKADVLDPLIIYCELVYNPHYAAIRKAVRKRNDLKRGLLGKYLHARSIVNKHRKLTRGAEPADPILTEWKRVLSNYPQLLFLPWVYLPMRIWNKVVHTP
jgi:glycosyltransferase involved in cell wall biosynthesis